jgi:hypothetical protein
MNEVSESFLQKAERSIVDVKYHRWLLDAFDARLEADYEVEIEHPPRRRDDLDRTSERVCVRCAPLAYRPTIANSKRLTSDLGLLITNNR